MVQGLPDDGVGILHFGLGEIGVALVRATASAAGLRSAGAVDIKPELHGRTLQDVFDTGGQVLIDGSLAESLIRGGKPQVAFHAAGSYLRDIEGQLADLMNAGLNVVTTSEELIRPRGESGPAAARLDAIAKNAGVSLFPAGVNPGFLMDRLPAYVTSMCLAPRAVTVRRTVDLKIRRNALRRKMGVAESAASVRARTDKRAMGHAGLKESVAYLADVLEWEIGEIDEQLGPIVAETRFEGAGEVVEVGEVLGLEHTARVSDRKGRRLSLELVMRIDAPQGIDEIEIDADPPLLIQIPGGLNGDVATVASVLNAARMVRGAAPGLVRQLSVPFANVY